MTRHRRLNATACVAIGSLLGSLPGAADETPHDWLNKMARAVQSTNYEGTVIRMKDGDVEALKVVHVVEDGVIRERVLIQDGKGLELIRNGNEVQCILPDKKSVLVEEWDESSALFSTLPSSNVRFGSEYDLRIVRKERVAGRKAIVLAVQPHDEYRFGHRIWIDVSTGFPLQTRLVGSDGDTIEEIMFADITLDQEIQASALQPSYSIEGFRWYTEPRRSVREDVETDWASDGLPPGFRVVATHGQQMPGSDDRVTHILLSDGLARVSVFVEPDTGKEVAERTKVGASHSYSFVANGHRITAVGDVPAATVEIIATSMQPR